MRQPLVKEVENGVVKTDCKEKGVQWRSSESGDNGYIELVVPNSFQIQAADPPEAVHDPHSICVAPNTSDSIESGAVVIPAEFCDWVAVLRAPWKNRAVFKELWRLHQSYAGLMLQYVGRGLCMGMVDVTYYGVFFGYLNVPGYRYQSIRTFFRMPSTFRLVFGLMNDCLPIRGSHRKSYMIIGWGFVCFCLLLASMFPLPAPHWCFKEDGTYLDRLEEPNGTSCMARACNPDSAESATKYAIILMFAEIGYVLIEVAADGLVTENAMKEPIESRGSFQSLVYIIRDFSWFSGTVLPTWFFNDKKFLGAFDWGIPWDWYLRIPAVLAFTMIFVTLRFVNDNQDGDRPQRTAREYFSLCWNAITGKAFFCTAVYCFFHPFLSQISTPAGPTVAYQWAGVRFIHRVIFDSIGCWIFMGGMLLVRWKFLNASWRKIIILAVGFTTLNDAVVNGLVIFDVFRNPFFYMGERLVDDVPFAFHHMVAMFVVVEMAEKGNEGMVYGLLTTVSNVSGPFATAVSNQVMSLFRPPLELEENFIADTPEFRLTVFQSYLLSYGFSMLSLAVLPCLPSQKKQAQERKRTWGQHRIVGIVTCIFVSVALVYSLVVVGLSILPSTACLKFAGGQGCEKQSPTQSECSIKMMKAALPASGWNVEE